jgi:hypothetical protein
VTGLGRRGDQVKPAMSSNGGGGIDSTMRRFGSGGAEPRRKLLAGENGWDHGAFYQAAKVGERVVHG